MTDPATLLGLKLGTMASGGGCVARGDDGRVVFVRHALPGERVVARVTAEASSYLRADAVEVLEASPDRVVPPCPHAGPGKCGGCDWQHVAIASQRSLKAGLISEQLRHLAGIDPPIHVEEVAGSPDGLAWRTRVRFTVDRRGRLGFFRHRSHEVEVVDRCPVAAPPVESVGAERHLWPGAASVEVAAPTDGEAPVVTVASGRRPLRQIPDVEAGVIVDGRTVRRPDSVTHTVRGRSYQVRPRVFWQVHLGAAEALTGAVIEGLEPRSGDRVLDLYAGAGLFAALLGDGVGPTGTVVAVDGDRRACADARRNTADQPHVRVRNTSVSPAVLGDGRVNLVVLDPPRAGAGQEMAAALAALRPRRMAYVACDPASFARDLRVLLDAGWTMPSLRAFDLFPMTEHVEVVAILEPPRTPDHREADPLVP